MAEKILAKSLNAINFLKILLTNLGWQIALFGVANLSATAQDTHDLPDAGDRLDLPDNVIQESPTLQRWLKEVPDLLEDIRHDPSFRTSFAFRLDYFSLYRRCSRNQSCS